MGKPEEFIAKIAPLVQKYAPKYGIKVNSPIIAQAVIESKYGESGLSKKANNFFGLKCGSKWEGKSINMTTQEEYTAGTMTTIKDNFRMYDSMEEGVIGYFEFIQLERYHNLRGITDPKKYCETIKADGYATSSTYVSTLMNAIEYYGLRKYDTSNSSTKVETKVGDTMADSSKVIQVALNEEGYLEKRTNAQLDSKTANAGSNNYTKYWRDVYPAYNGQYWCDCFVKWCFIKAYGTSEAKKLLCHGSNGWSFYTPTSAQYFKNKGQWYSSPKAGDQIFFRNSSRICHTGIVTRVSGNTVYTIEGNTTSASGVVANGGCVRQKSYMIGSWNIAGYGRPAYSSSTPVNGGSSSGSGGKSSYSKTVQWTGKVTADSLNVRKGPGTNYDRLTSYPSIANGTKVGVCDSTNASNGKKWYYVKITGSQGEKYGFVSSDYIKKIEGSSSSTTYYKVTATMLNMRKSAGDGQIITSLKNGTKVEYLDKDTTVSGTKWLYVKSGSNKGWCSSKYLKKV